MSFCGKIEGWFLGWVKAGVCPEKKVCDGLLWLPIILYPEMDRINKNKPCEDNLRRVYRSNCFKTVYTCP